MSNPLTLFFDGGCRPNPGPLEAAVVARGLSWFNDDLGHGSSGDAEWRALAFALEVAQGLGARDVRLVGDARAVIEQARGRWPCRGAGAQAHLAVFRELAARFDRVRLRHVARSHNLAGFALEHRRRAGA